MASKEKQLLAYAKEKAETAKYWPELHNAIYGVGGKAFELFPDQKSRDAFFQSDTHREIMEMVRGLRSTDNLLSPEDASGRFNLRLPKSLHAALAAEADAEGVSLNQLCLSKLAVQLRQVVS